METTKIKSGRGGKRVGAGRKSTFLELERVTVTLTPDQVVYLTQLGGGNVSAGIRRAIAKSKEPPFVTKNWLLDWVAEYRPGIELDNGTKAGATDERGNHIKGATWRDIGIAIGAIEPDMTTEE